MRLAESVSSPSPQSWSFGTLKGLETSMIPELMRYSRETDSSIAAARQDNRRRLFAVCPYLPDAVRIKTLIFYIYFGCFM